MTHLPAPASTHRPAIIKVDESGTVTAANRQAVELTRYEETELIGLAVERLVPKGLLRQRSQGMERTAHDPGSTSDDPGGRLVLRTKSGDDVPVVISIHTGEQVNEVRYVIEKSEQTVETSPAERIGSIVLDLGQTDSLESSLQQITEFAMCELSKIFNEKLVVYWECGREGGACIATQKFLNGKQHKFVSDPADTSAGTQLGRAIQTLGDIQVTDNRDTDALVLPDEIASRGYRGGAATIVSGRHAPAGVITVYFRSRDEACTEQELHFLRRIADAVGFSLSRYSVESSLLKELAVQEILTRVGQVISHSINLREQIAEVAATVSEIIEHDRFVIAFIEDAGTSIVEKYVAGRPVGNRIPSHVPISGNTELEDLVLTGVPILRSGAKSRLVGQTSAVEKAYLQAGFRSLLAVPIVWQSNVMAVLCFRSENEDAYGAEELSMALRVSDMLSGAIANTNLLAKIELEQKKQRILAEITRVAAIDLDLARVFGRVTEEIQSLVHYDSISISLFDPEKTELVLAFVDGVEITGKSVGHTVSISLAQAGWKETIEGRAGDREPEVNGASAGAASTLEVTLGTRAAGPIGFIQLSRSSTDAYSKFDLGLMIDVAERVTPAVQNSLAHQQQVRLVESQSRYQELFNNAPDMILSVDIKTGLVLDHNETTVTVLGYTSDELKMLTIFELYHPDYSDVARNVIRQFRDLGQVVDSHAKFVRKDGTTLDVSVNVTAVRDPAGKIVGSISTVRDITVSAESELAAKNARRLDTENRELVRINEVRSEFLSRVSHELRTPLTALLAFGSILSRNKGDTMTPKQLEQLAYIRNNGWRLEELINDLLDVSRSQIETYKIEHRNFELIAVVEESVDSAAAIFEQRNQNLYLKHEGGPVWVNGDMKRVAQVVGNLLSNASKFSPDESDIEVRLSTTIGGIEIKVTDKGIGIGEEDVARLFTPFFRADNEQTRKAGGTGLGLVIVRTIAELHGGNVSITSKLGVGTTVKVYLPTIGFKYVAGEGHESEPRPAPLNAAS